MRSLRFFIFSAALLLIMVPAASAKQSAGRAVPITAAPAFTAPDLVAEPNGNWITAGGNLYNQRYSPLNQINTSNVGSLKVAWQTHLDGSGAAAKYSQEATPLVYNGVMYVATGNNDVFALDATTGEHLWTYLSHTDQLNATVCCGWDNRGVGLGDGKVFIAQLDGALVALDQLTGGVVWTAQNARWQEGYTMTMPVTYYDGLVYVGVSGAEFGSRGSFTAYNATTGARVWRFYTVPLPGDIGGGTWPTNNEWQNGGATTWNNPTIDPATNTLIFTTGNADAWSGRGPGDNLFTSSFVALNAKTGDYKWHYQMVHHDIWDYDCPSPTVMFDVTIGGVVRQGVAEACKTGWVYELDRNTGKPLIGIPEKKVPQNKWNNTSLTQPYPVGDAFSPQCPRTSDYTGNAADGKPYKLGCIFTPYDYKGFVAIAPSAIGGNNWPPMSWNPNTHALYVCSSDSGLALKAVDPKQVQPFSGGKTFINVQFGKLAIYSGSFTAMDATTNRIIWQRKQPKGDNCYSGSFSTGGGLVFWGHNDGTYEAANAATGEKLWSLKLQSGANAPGITYTVNGKQYVAVVAGGNSILGAIGVLSKADAAKLHGDSVYVFAMP